MCIIRKMREKNNKKKTGNTNADNSIYIVCRVIYSYSQQQINNNNKKYLI